MTKSLSKFFTYRYRYQIGYSLIIVAFIALLVVAGLYVPGGLSKAEVTQFVQTSSIDLQNINTVAIPNMPFFAVQRLSLNFLGPTEFAFKLPSLICAAFAGIGAVLLLRRWYKPNIAVLAAVIMITTGQFLYIAQSATGTIMYILWPVWLLLIATMITTSPHHKRFWKVLFFIAMPLSLYTPLSIYLVLAILSAGLLHPHVRYVIKKMSRAHLIILTFLSIIIASPLMYLVFNYPDLGLRLLGVPTEWPIDVWNNIKVLFQQYFNFFNPESGNIMTPVLGLGSMVLILLGVWQLYLIRYTARSYTLTAWIILLIPLLLINPYLSSITFVPLLLLLASGLSFILRSWYKIFPLNPYARIVGLIPIAILVAGLVISGLGRYFDGYRYDPGTASTFTHDLSLFNQQVSKRDTTTIVVKPSEQQFYTAIAKFSPDTKITVITTIPTKSGEYLATRAAHNDIDAIPSQIITTAYTNDSDRFYIYKK